MTVIDLDRPAVSPRRRSTAARRRRLPDDLRLTSDGRFLMEQRARHLLEREIPVLRAVLDAEHDDDTFARFERLCVEAVWLRRILDQAETLPRPGGDVVELGAYVQLEMADGETMWVRPVHPVEAFLDEERISAASPLSRAILGARSGDLVTVEGPAGPWSCAVVAISVMPPDLDEPDDALPEDVAAS
ncbi:MAG: GreA/GreB family elongation factor [Dehalococcoidia bacterium]|jgi:transcription elongation GreA/GreB family factor